MLRLGLTGGIGAGKSTVSRMLADLGGVLVDADVIAREVVEPGTTGLAQLVEAFGEGILDSDGALDRPALAVKAFGDDESRDRLNSVLHPLIGRRTAEIIADAPDDAVVIQDIPLIVEKGMGVMFPLVAVVFVEAEERIHRLVHQRNMSEQDARARIAAQATDDARRAAADIWLDNSGAPGDLDEAVRTLWTERLVPFEQNMRDGVVAGAGSDVVAADPTWAAQAERLMARIALACGISAVRIDHVGATSVGGLDARDVLDIQITVASIEVADTLAEPLRGIGFPPVGGVESDRPIPSYAIGGEADPSLWDKRLHGNADPGRAANIHIRVDDRPGQRFALLFGDWLRADADAANEFVEVERQAAVAATADADRRDAADAHADITAPWFDQAYGRAWEWAEHSGWTP